MRLQVRAGAAIGALALIACARAHAGEARCIWERIPETERSAVLAHEADTLADTLRATVSDEEYIAALTGCGATVDTAKAAGSALNAYALQLKSEQALSGDPRLAPDRLDAAWNGLDETLRGRLSKHVIDETAEPDAALAALQTFGDRLGLAEDLASGQRVALTTYVMSRAARSVFEPQF